jgi:signal transduction histidine kinase/ActR/RegA family two-component response regulator
MRRLQLKLHLPLLAIWLTLAVVGVILSGSVWQQLWAEIDAAAANRVFTEKLNEVVALLQEAESGTRGYVITGDDLYLEALNQAEGKLTRDFEQLADFARRERAISNDLLELRAQTELKLEALRRASAVRRQQGFEAASALVKSGDNKSLLERIRRIVAQMASQPNDLFSEKGQIMRARMHQAEMTAAIAGVFAVGAGLFAIYLSWVTHRQERSQKELLEQKLHAEKTTQEKTTFLANMSHEIRTPMNAILGFSELLSEEPLSPRQSEYARSIRQSGRALLQLINDVLDLSKIEAGMMQLTLQPTDLRETCAFLSTMFSQQAAQKSLELRLEVAPEMPDALLLDRLRLRQILVNLVNNAIKFTSKGHVAVRVGWNQQAGSRSVGTLVIDVEDTGAGISPEKQQDVFNPFVQAKTRGAPENGGTGLGLSIVKRLTEMTNGTVNLESGVGKGSVFHLRFPNVSVSARLPVSDEREETEPAAGAGVTFNNLAPATLLVVDDNEANRHLLGSMFRKSHHELHFAGNGREALQIISQVRPDVVLLDIRMPVMDGWRVLEEIRKRPELELLVVIAVTTSNLASEEAEVRKRFNGYLRKPFSRQALFHELAQFLPPAARAIGSTRPAPLPGAGNGPPSNWRALAADLRRLQAEDWPALRDVLAVNETRAFAEKLHDLGESASCEPLTNYAEDLATYADTYAVGNLERRLAEFPSLVETIEGAAVDSDASTTPA